MWCPDALFVADPYSRPAEKRGGAWMDEVAGRSRLLAPQGSAVRLPVAHMVCNSAEPVGGKPATLTFREVETLAHELGQYAPGSYLISLVYCLHSVGH
jgi:oligopeptidase A